MPLPIKKALDGATLSIVIVYIGLMHIYAWLLSNDKSQSYLFIIFFFCHSKNDVFFKFFIDLIVIDYY